MSARSLFPIRFLCKWFQIAVLPLDKLLYAELFKTEDKKRCTECGTSFVSTSNSVKYCPDCRKRITRRQAAERMRKRRARLRGKGKKSLDLRGINDVKLARDTEYLFP